MMVLAFIPQIVIALVYVVGIVLAIVTMPRIGRAAVFAIIGLILQLLATGGSAASTVLVFSARERAMTMAEIGAMTSVIGLVVLVLHIGAYGLLFAAIFARRDVERAS
jgi:hypothetical protein